MPELNSISGKSLRKAVRISNDKILNKSAYTFDNLQPDERILVTLVAGKGTRFGKDPVKFIPEEVRVV